MVFICVHWYGGPNPTWLLNLVDGLWKTYSLPIWITEFGVADWSATTKSQYSLKDTMNFMNGVIPQLEQRSYIQRYAWFDFNPTDVAGGPSALTKHDSAATMTDLGKLYESLGGTTK